MARMEVSSANCAGHSFLHRLARRVSLSRPAAESPLPRVQKRSCRLVDRFGPVWLLPHHEPGISQLALRSSCHHCGNFLRLDVAQNRINLCLGACPWRRGHHLAFPFPDLINLQVAVGRTCVGGTMTLEEALVKVWRTALVENAAEVTLDEQTFPVRTTP